MKSNVYPYNTVSALWLTAPNDLIERRILHESRYKEKAPREQEMIDKFVKRSLVYNRRMMDLVMYHGLLHLVVGTTTSPEELCDKCLMCLSKQRAEEH